jgi:hypothetical protein
VASSALAGRGVDAIASRVDMRVGVRVAGLGVLGLRAGVGAEGDNLGMLRVLAPLVGVPGLVS